jgi:hypothetical protein
MPHEDKDSTVDRRFVRLYTLLGAWACTGAAIPPLVRGITWLGIHFAVGAILMAVLGLHPRMTRERDQPTLVAWSYGPVIGCLAITTSFIGLSLGAFSNPLWLLYFASLLGLFAATMEAFTRIGRSTSPTSPPALEA